MNNFFSTRRRPTSTVTVGSVKLGSEFPVRVQSMASTSTRDIEGSEAQIERIAAAGASFVRLTAQGVMEAECIGRMDADLRAKGLDIPLVADIHFNPRAALAAAEVCAKVRINPGNFVDPGRVFKKLEYTDEEYAAELRRIAAGVHPLLEICRRRGTALRIGVNHGSLSDRIMSRYGDTPAGMVESAMEFLRVCVAEKFFNVVISIKASNTVVMVETVRRLVKAMDSEGMHFPLHLGVTEAGDGEDGRVKSAVGIGTLLLQGIGDTIRVSLSEDPEFEVPVAESLLRHIEEIRKAAAVEGETVDGFDTCAPQRLMSEPVGNIGGTNQPAVMAAGTREAVEMQPDYWLGEPSAVKFVELDANGPMAVKPERDAVILLRSSHVNQPGSIQAARHRLLREGVTNPVVAWLDYKGLDRDSLTLAAAADGGALLLNGMRDGLLITADGVDTGFLTRLTFGILQAARTRITRTEYISCPSCGRTMFDLQSTVAAVKAATSHLTGLKIGVMGCVVNGPGEMADADYGYVGAAAGHVSLYKGKQCVQKNIPADQAIERLVQLIKDCGDWKER